MVSSGSPRLGERGEAPQVGEDRDDLAAVAAQERLVPAVDDQLGDLRRQEPAQPAEPFELGHLRGHPLLELLVPRRRSAAACATTVSW